MKCPKCEGTGEMQICEMGFIGKDECDKCHGKGYLNNEEWMKSCDTEQLAEWIKGHMNCNFCPMRLKCEDMRNCMEHIKAWLKQPHEQKGD